MLHVVLLRVVFCAWSPCACRQFWIWCRWIRCRRIRCCWTEVAGSGVLRVVFLYLECCGLPATFQGYNSRSRSSTVTSHRIWEERTSSDGHLVCLLPSVLHLCSLSELASHLVLPICYHLCSVLDMADHVHIDKTNEDSVYLPTRARSANSSAPQDVVPDLSLARPLPSIYFHVYSG